jgi:tyrosinase
MSILTRKSIDALTNAEWDQFVEALNAYKIIGAYDLMTQRHSTAMTTLMLLPGETGTGRNIAHRGPAFFTWHRQALRELELNLCAIQKELHGDNVVLVGIPYYRWNVDVANWRTHPIWNRIGGNGVSTNGYLINTGPFAGWTSTIRKSDGTFRPRAGIVRRFSTSGNMPSWGNTSIVNYDVSPWSENSSASTSFRNFMEAKHNTVHTRIGGDMNATTSPNDPVFYFHHCNVDRAWTRWQVPRGLTNFQPRGAVVGPPGHHWDHVPAQLASSEPPYQKINGEMLDRINFDLDPTGSFVIANSGFTYDTLVP